MKANLTTDQSQQNYFFRIGEGYLFVRSETEDIFNKLAQGRQGLKVIYSEINARGTSIKAFLDLKQLINTYNLPKNFEFDFSSKAFEFVTIENVYQDIKKNLTGILINNPEATFKDILDSKDLRRRHNSQKSKGRVGRQRVYRDESTGKIIGMKRENLEIVKLWETGIDFESIRFAMYPTTKTPPRKKTEISKIKRKLREYKNLLTRKYDGK
jgi:hypothetical protein